VISSHKAWNYLVTGHHLINSGTWYQRVADCVLFVFLEKPLHEVCSQTNRETIQIEEEHRNDACLLKNTSIKQLDNYIVNQNSENLMHFYDVGFRELFSNVLYLQNKITRSIVIVIVT